MYNLYTPQKENARAGGRRATSKYEQAYNSSTILATQGIPCFPCSGNKVPTCPNGFKNGTTDLHVLSELWTKYPGLLVGVQTGELAGFDVLDIDPRNGGDKWLDANMDRLPRTRTHESRSGGVHYYFLHRNGQRSSSGVIGPGVDVRADGGCIIWWPAANFRVLDDSPIAEWPDWVVQLMKPKSRPLFIPDSVRTVGNNYATAALRNASHTVATAPEGRRNDTLNREAFSVLRFVLDGSLRVQDIVNTLAAAALSSGLARSEVMATLVSALRARGIV